MNLAGKIFSFLNIILTVLLAMLASVVVEYRTNKLKQIETIEKDIAANSAKVEQKEREKPNALAQLSRVESSYAVEDSAIKRAKVQYDAQNAVSTNKLNDYRSQADGWTDSANKIRAETKARENEQQEFEGQKAQIGTENNNLNGAIAELQKTLSETQEKLTKARADVAKAAESVLKSSNVSFEPPAKRRIVNNDQ